MGKLRKCIRRGTGREALGETLRSGLRDAVYVGSVCLRAFGRLGSIGGALSGGLYTLTMAKTSGVVCWILGGCVGVIAGGLCGTVLGALLGAAVAFLMGSLVVVGAGTEVLVGPRPAPSVGTGPKKPGEMTPAQSPSTPAEAFLDTSYAIALAAPGDQLHARAVQLATQLQAAQSRLVTTRAVMLEIGNALAKLRYRSAAVQLLQALEEDSTVEIITLSDDLFAQSFELFRTRPDKEWGLIDCVSFVVMGEHGIRDALTADEHFQQMGFRALLRDTAS